MAQLGDILLSDELILTGLESAVPVVVNQRRTITGRLLYRTDPAPGGRSLTLSGENHFTYDQIAAVTDLAALGAPVTLLHHRGSFSVLIVGIQMEPSQQYSDPTGADWLSGSILLLEV